MTEAKPLSAEEIENLRRLTPEGGFDHRWIATIEARDARIAEQDRRIGELEEALRFYAKGAFAKYFHDGIYEINLASGEGGHVKLGTRARAALKGAKIQRGWELDGFPGRWVQTEGRDNA